MNDSNILARPSQQEKKGNYSQLLSLAATLIINHLK